MFVTIRTCWFGEKNIKKLNNATIMDGEMLNKCSKCKKYVTYDFQKCLPPNTTTPPKNATKVLLIDIIYYNT